MLARDCVGHHAHSVLLITSNKARPDALIVVIQEAQGLSWVHWGAI